LRCSTTTGPNLEARIFDLDYKPDAKIDENLKVFEKPKYIFACGRNIIFDQREDLCF
jgi:hypothetical protein